ncbi:hypothetical protein B0A56_12895 [Flavobacterium columnare NBRC 100251 = ATCC 23463]|uniref:hypothetical protein n=1 Tax=Flavobacterium covae TaxID=2906076 RepID=UPI000B5BBC20|nr:hypothetical protein B0A56_12895 [Flavobacterium columnare NBRC 100251 = ATCC 23463]
MTDEQLSIEIKKEIIVKNLERYFDTLENSKEVFVNNSWRKVQILFESLNDENKENLKEFVKMILIETTTDLLSFIDDLTRFEGQSEGLELRYNDEKISGSLQEYLLMDIEDNGL